MGQLVGKRRIIIVILDVMQNRIKCPGVKVSHRATAADRHCLAVNFESLIEREVDNRHTYSRSLSRFMTSFASSSLSASSLLFSPRNRSYSSRCRGVTYSVS